MPTSLATLDFQLPAFELVPFFRDARFADAVGGHPLHEQPVHRARRNIEGAEAPGVQAQRRAGDALAHELHSCPGIFLQLAHAFFQMRAGDQLDGVEAGAIHGFGDRQHHARGHVLGPQALMAVADGGVYEFNPVDRHYYSVSPKHRSYRRGTENAEYSYFTLSLRVLCVSAVNAFRSTALSRRISRRYPA